MSRKQKRIFLYTATSIFLFFFFHSSVWALQVPVEPDGLPLESAVFNLYFEGEVSSLQVTDPQGLVYIVEDNKENPIRISMPLAVSGVYLLSITGEISSFYVMMEGEEMTLELETERETSPVETMLQTDLSTTQEQTESSASTEQSLEAVSETTIETSLSTETTKAMETTYVAMDTFVPETQKTIAITSLFTTHEVENETNTENSTIHNEEVSLKENAFDSVFSAFQTPFGTGKENSIIWIFSLFGVCVVLGFLSARM